MHTSKKAVKMPAKLTGKHKIKIERGSSNVFKDLGFADAEAESLLVRCDLMIEIEKIIEMNRWSQAQAAKILGIAQPRISELIHGNLERFTVDTLIRYLSLLGRKVTFSTKPVAA